MRVLITTDTIGGVWTFTRELSGSLLAQGHDVALVSFGRTMSEAQQSWADAMTSQFRDRFLMRQSDAPLEWMDGNSQTFHGGADLLSETAGEFKAELLHSNQFCWGALRLGIPCVVTAHSDVLSWADACRQGTLPTTDWLADYRKLVGDGLAGATEVTAPTQWMLNALQVHFPVSCPRRVIYNGRTISPSKHFSKRKAQAISVGRLWDEAKGLETIVAAQSTMPIVLVGEQQLQQGSADTSGLSFLGALSESELLDRFRESSIYIAASVYEPFGLAPLEAALCGCAIVARDIPSLREVWGDAALYFETASQLSALLNACARTPSTLRVAQLRAMERARLYTAERMSKGYIGLYRSLLAEADRRARQEAIETHAA